MKTLLAILLCSTFAALADSPPLPPGMVTPLASPRMTVKPAPDNFIASVGAALPFRYGFRQSGGWCLLSLIVTRSNVTRFRVEASTNVNFTWANAAWAIFNPAWPWTNHLQGFNDNLPGRPFGPPSQMFYRIFLP